MKTFACLEVKLYMVIGDVLYIDLRTNNGLVLRRIMKIEMQVINPGTDIEQPFPGFQRFIYKGVGPVSKLEQGVVWPKR